MLNPLIFVAGLMGKFIPSGAQIVKLRPFSSATRIVEEKNSPDKSYDVTMTIQTYESKIPLLETSLKSIENVLKKQKGCLFVHTSRCHSNSLVCNVYTRWDSIKTYQEWLRNLHFTSQIRSLGNIKIS